MIAEYPYGRRYLLTALEAGPVVIGSLITGMSQEEADFRPDPDRFTMREVVAHLAEWDPIFTGRMMRMVQEDHPTMPGFDEAVLAIEHNYAALDPFEQLAKFTSGRTALVDYLREISDSDWTRTGDRPEIGIVTVEAIAVLIPLHDAYHAKQIVEWRGAFDKR